MDEVFKLSRRKLVVILKLLLPLANCRELDLMSDMSRYRFKHFTDAEIEAPYGYLVARTQKLLN